MELGITIPLQKFLKRRAPLYGTQRELFFCWDLHVIRYHGKDTLVAVNASNCFTAVMWDMRSQDWKMLTGRSVEAIRSGLLAAGYTGAEVDRYFELAGAAQITKTHGRRPVAGLNRMIEFLQFAPAEMNADEMYQALPCRFANSNVCRAAGFPEVGAPEEFLEADMRRCGIVEDAGADGKEQGEERQGDERQPVECQLVERQPAECQPVECQLVECQPAECQPAECQPAAAQEPPSCPCRRKCPRKGDCQACIQFHEKKKTGIPVACRHKTR